MPVKIVDIGGSMENGWAEEVHVLRKKVTNLSHNIETANLERDFYMGQEAKAQEQLVALRGERDFWYHEATKRGRNGN